VKNFVKPCSRVKSANITVEHTAHFIRVDKPDIRVLQN